MTSGTRCSAVALDPLRQRHGRRILRLCAAAALGLTMLLTQRTTVLAQTDEPLGFIKANPTIIGGQIDLGVNYLTSALSILESSQSPADLEAASARAYQAYRMMRFADSGLVLLGSKNKRAPNPLYGIVSETLWGARWLIIDARLLIDGAAKYWDDAQNSQNQRTEAITKLRRALAIAEQARTLI